MQHYFIYPANKAQESQKALKRRGYKEIDFQNLNEQAQDLETRLNYAGFTLLSCDWRAKGKYSTIWNIKISTPGHCDIFSLLDSIRLSFDLNGLDETFSFINTNIQNTEVYIEFTISA